MRRSVTQAAAAATGQGRKSVAPSALRSGSTHLRTAAARQAPIRDAYVALSDFFRSNLPHAEPRAKTGTSRHVAASKWSAVSYPSRSTSLHIRPFSSTSRWALQQPPSSSSSAAEQEQSKKQSTADHASNSHDGHRTADQGTSQAQTSAAKPSTSSAPAPDVLDHVSSFPRSLRQLAMSLPTASLRRPTKDE